MLSFTIPKFRVNREQTQFVFLDFFCKIRNCKSIYKSSPEERHVDGKNFPNSSSGLCTDWSYFTGALPHLTGIDAKTNYNFIHSMTFITTMTVSLVLVKFCIKILKLHESNLPFINLIYRVLGFSINIGDSIKMKFFICSL